MPLPSSPALPNLLGEKFAPSNPSAQAATVAAFAYQREASSSQLLANHKHSLMSPEEKLSVHFALLIATVHHGIARNWSISGTGSAQRVTLLKTTAQTGVETRMAEVRERERGRKPVQVHTVCALLYKSAVMNREARGVSNKASSNCFFLHAK